MEELTWQIEDTRQELEKIKKILTIPLKPELREKEESLKKEMEL